MMMTFSYCKGKFEGINFDYMGYSLFKTFSWETRKQILWRVFYGYFSQIVAMVAIYFLPLAVSQSILGSAVFATMFCGYLILDEKLSTREILTIIGGVAGVLILLNPEWFGHTYGQKG